MGKLGRFAAIFIPMGLTIASLICLSIVCIGQTSKGMQLSNDLWFFKANTKDFNKDPNLKLDKIPNLDNNLLKALQGAAETKELKDFYKVGLRGHCEGDIDADGKETVTSCTKPRNYYWFNPVEVWGLNNTSAQKLFPNDMQKALDSYHKVSRWMTTAYALALVCTAVEILVGISALFSRWGSLATTVISSLSSIFSFAAAVTVTAIYASLVAVFETVLKPYNIKATMGKQILGVLWLGVAFSLASGLFWLFSVCCCSGKNNHKKVVVEKTPYTYERVASPYLGGSANSHQMHPIHPAGGHGHSGSAYEPFRHGRH